MRPYTQLTQTERYQIYALMQTQQTQKAIAQVLNVHKSTGSREVRRNGGQQGYRPHQAHRLVLQRRQAKESPRIAAATWHAINTPLGEDWSPEQISDWLKGEPTCSVNSAWVYQHILQDKATGDDLHRLGDWEVDTIIDCGPQQALVSITERRSRLTLFPKVVQKTADQVRDAVRGLLAPLTSTGYCQLKENSTLNRQIAWRQFLDLAGITLCTPHVQSATSGLS